MATIPITDPNLVTLLMTASSPLRITDPASGKVVGTFDPSDRHGSPISDEELDRRRRTYRDGKPLADILNRLRREHP